MLVRCNTQLFQGNVEIRLKKLIFKLALLNGFFNIFSLFDFHLIFFIFRTKLGILKKDKQMFLFLSIAMLTFEGLSSTF